MKKLLAILTSALLLCTMIPFATVSATEITEPTIWVSTLEANAGDEIQVEVKLLNNPGVIAATVEILYDHDVMELVTYYDEDEEMWLPQIEVGATYNASSNKYITFGPIDEETGVAKKCVVSYIRGTAKSNCDNEDFFTATFKIKDDAISGTYPLALQVDPDDFFTLNFEPVEFDVAVGEITVIGADPEPDVPACEHEYFTPCEQYCMHCGELTNPDASHNVVHAAAKAPTCAENGNLEHWYCDVCGAAWLDADCSKNTNLKAVKLPATGEHTYDDEYDADCNVCGDIREVPEKPVEIAYGDLNGDGAINNRDMALMQQFINKWDVQIDEAAADVNKDGAINNRDLALLQQYINKWDVTLG